MNDDLTRNQELNETVASVQSDNMAKAATFTPPEKLKRSILSSLR